ncbi:cytochrome c-type biogenesis protein [Rubrimonas cliftonensis]|uniref:Cytochrome c-type biogenesis protein n=1 Tax=Rubrimonas cliftonensis TaxID=89524 RepID=A0A1H3VX58_9RHOB|nr:cytochrome c-type biogenesis protein [Rubrimonas cliftonensis]SDZ79435.1 cytochrome c-type biogenesis protein CcmH [Rubrimonas cliftonensis]
MIRAVLLAATLALSAGPAPAVQPDEVLADPALESRAREISKELRCLVCRNEAIDDSNAELARILRLLVRERVVAGDSDGEVIDYVVDRYGEYVLLRPRFTLGNALIWLSGPLILALGGFAAWRYVRARAPQAAAQPAPLTEAERRDLDALLRDGS